MRSGTTLPDETFLIELELGDPLQPRLRVRLVTDRGRVNGFSVQLEILLESRHLAVVRYDGSHGTAHRDLLDREGYSYRKSWLQGMPFGQAVNHGIIDLRGNWRDYADDFMRREGFLS